MILSQFTNAGNKNKTYREKAQEYSKEEGQIWEDLKHGIIFGSEDFVSKIKSAYLPDSPDSEMPQQKKIMAKEFDSEKLLNMAAKHLDCDLKRFKEMPRISSKEKENRDILIYLLWKTGRLANANIGNLFGVTCSSVSHSVRALSNRLKKDKELRHKINGLYSSRFDTDTNNTILLFGNIRRSIISSTH